MPVEPVAAARRGYTGRLNSGYCCVMGFLKMCLKAFPKPLSVPNGCIASEP